MVIGVNHFTQGGQVLAQPASCVDSVLRHGYTWSMANDSALKNIAARTLIPVVAAVAAVIDTVGNIVAAALKMLVLPLNVVVSVITYLLPGYQVGIDPSLTPYAILANLYRAAASVAFVAIGPLLSFASPSSALDLARFASLAAAPQPAPVELTRWEQFRQNFPEDSFWAKTKYVASEAFKASVDGISSAASSVKYHTWTRCEENPIVLVTLFAVLALAYVGGSLYTGDWTRPYTWTVETAAGQWNAAVNTADRARQSMIDGWKWISGVAAQEAKDAEEAVKKLKEEAAKKLAEAAGSWTWLNQLGYIASEYPWPTAAVTVSLCADMFFEKGLNHFVFKRITRALIGSRLPKGWKLQPPKIVVGDTGKNSRNSAKYEQEVNKRWFYAKVGVLPYEA